MRNYALLPHEWRIKRKAELEEAERKRRTEEERRRLERTAKAERARVESVRMLNAKPAEQLLVSDADLPGRPRRRPVVHVLHRTLDAELSVGAHVEPRPAIVSKSLCVIGAEERTRTSTGLLPPAPQAGASANSATSARVS